MTNATTCRHYATVGPPQTIEPPIAGMEDPEHLLVDHVCLTLRTSRSFSTWTQPARCAWSSTATHIARPRHAHRSDRVRFAGAALELASQK